MKIIFDLDYTLLDTKKIHEKLAEIFDKENYREDYQRFFKDKGISFDGEKYLEILKNNGRIDGIREKELKSRLAEMLSQMDDFLMPGAEAALKHYVDNGDEPVLITFGNKKWQEEKVRNLSIKKYFTNIIYEEKDKSQSEYLRSLGEKDEEVRFVNDRLKEVKEFERIFGKKAKMSLMLGDYNEGAEPDIKNLHELIPEEKRENNLGIK